MTSPLRSWISHTLHERYQIKSSLGSGGMATVYKAIDTNLQRHVAIKLIHSHLAQQAEFIRRFEQEATAVASVRHPNIVPVYDFNNDRGIYYMVLAYMAGGNLDERLKTLQKANQHMPLAEVIDLMITLCEAVGYAHKQKIVHRDLKPANVLFDEHENPYLTDFGVARLVSNAESMTVIGTPTYMSPEQIQGDQNLDQRSDLYSLGVMLYEMIAGQPPFEGNPALLMYKHMYEPIPDIRLFRDHLPEGLIAIIEKALAKTPADRFQSAIEMYGALRTMDLLTTQSEHASAVAASSIILQEANPTEKLTRLLGGKRRAWIIALFLLAIIALPFFLNLMPIDSDKAKRPSPILNKPTDPNDVGATLASPPLTATLASSPLTATTCPTDMVLIPAGHFCLHIHEVTNRAYRECVSSGTCSEPKFQRSLTRENYYDKREFDDYPVIQVTWQQANQYCQSIGKRLPTVSEWMAAYQTLVEKPSDDEITTADDTQPLQSFQKDMTPQGVYDLAGNVREWVEDSEGSVNKFVKGQSVASTPNERNSYLPTSSDWFIGFRCAANVQ